MSKALWQYLVGAYVGSFDYVAKKQKMEYPIQIDDQDDDDNLADFCNMFVTVRKSDHFSLSISNYPYITARIADLAEIYGGEANFLTNAIRFPLSLRQICVVIDLAACMQDPQDFLLVQRDIIYDQIAARTVSSLYRFTRVLKEFPVARRFPVW